MQRASISREIRQPPGLDQSMQEWRGASVLLQKKLPTLVLLVEFNGKPVVQVRLLFNSPFNNLFKAGDGGRDG